jgi:2-haloacid dehalogenase
VIQRLLSAITFDCYGTLVDWEGGITSFLHGVLREKGSNVSVAELVRVREDFDFELVQDTYHGYKEILHLSLRETFNQFGIPYANRDGDSLAESVPTWPIFKDAKPALDRLAQITNLAIISNIDNDMIEKTKSRLGIKFHFTVTAQDVGAYKPGIRPFQVALQKLGCNAGDVLHVSSGFRYDIPPARQLGFRTAWINRKHEKKPLGSELDYEFGNLTEFADFVERKLR